MASSSRDDLLGSHDTASLFDVSPVPTLVHDPETGAILDVNAACAELWGYDAESLCEMDVEEFSPTVDDGAERPGEDFEKTMVQGEHTFDWEIRRADGSRATVRVELRRVRWNDAEHSLAYVTDVTENRKRERVPHKADRFRRFSRHHQAYRGVLANCRQDAP